STLYVTTAEIIILTDSDKIPPTTPSNTRLLDVTDTTARIAWDASTDNVGVAYYEIYEGEGIVGTTSGTCIYI
ncbi:hypothetical protein P0P47_08485, partial [Campylobacter jejuni]